MGQGPAGQEGVAHQLPRRFGEDLEGWPVIRLKRSKLYFIMGNMRAGQIYACRGLDVLVQMHGWARGSGAFPWRWYGLFAPRIFDFGHLAPIAMLFDPLGTEGRGLVEVYGASRLIMEYETRSCRGLRPGIYLPITIVTCHCDIVKTQRLVGPLDIAKAWWFTTCQTPISVSHE